MAETAIDTKAFENTARYESLMEVVRGRKPSYKRWKKRLDQIVSWDRFARRSS